jgi:hypothetical protein
MNDTEPFVSEPDGATHVHMNTPLNMKRKGGVRALKGAMEALENGHVSRASVVHFFERLNCPRRFAVQLLHVREADSRGKGVEQALPRVARRACELVHAVHTDDACENAAAVSLYRITETLDDGVCVITHRLVWFSWVLKAELATRVAEWLLSKLRAEFPRELAQVLLDPLDYDELPLPLTNRRANYARAPPGLRGNAPVVPAETRWEFVASFSPAGERVDAQPEERSAEKMCVVPFRDSDPDEAEAQLVEAHLRANPAAPLREKEPIAAIDAAAVQGDAE